MARSYIALQTGHNNYVHMVNYLATILFLYIHWLGCMQQKLLSH